MSKILFVLCCFIALPIFAQEYVANEVLVRFRNVAAAQAFEATNTRNGGEMIPVIAEWQLYRYHDARQSTTELLANLSHESGVSVVQPNHLLSPRNTPNDPDYLDFQWDMDIIHAPKVWETNTGGTTALGDTIVIAILDSGFDFRHPDLAPNVWHNAAEIPNNGIDDDGNGYIDDVTGWNFAQNTPHLDTTGFHGTAVAGIAGARGNNGIGIAGVNWNVRLMLLQTGYTEASVVAAYYYALTQRKLYNQTAHQTQRKGAFVVSTNASLGANNAFPIDFPLWCAVYDSLGQAGVLSCGATTNTNVDVGSAGDIPSLCPSPYLVVVTNTNRHDQKVGAGYSNIYVDLAAPGDDTFSTYPKGGYGNFSGTSGATPHVTGAVGLLYSDPDPALINAARQAPANTALVIKSALLNSVDKLPSLGGKTVSGGRLNIAAARAALYEQLERVDTAFAVVGVYPNPASESITIAFNLPPAQTYTYNIYTIVGQLIETRAVSLVGTVRTAKLDTSRYASGVYFVHYTDVAGKAVVRKFVINH